MNYKTLQVVNYIVIHCAATPPQMDIGVKEIDRWHRERGFFQIGYHFVIRRNGVIEKGRDESIPGAHVRGHNHESLGICLVGGVTQADVKVAENNFTPEQFESLRLKLIELKAKYPNAKILGHRDLELKDHAKLKDCPSFEVADWLKQVNL